MSFEFSLFMWWYPSFSFLEGSISSCCSSVPCAMSCCLFLAHSCPLSAVLLLQVVLAGIFSTWGGIIFWVFFWLGQVLSSLFPCLPMSLHSLPSPRGILWGLGWVWVSRSSSSPRRSSVHLNPKLVFHKSCQRTLHHSTQVPSFLFWGRKQNVAHPLHTTTPDVSLSGLRSWRPSLGHNVHTRPALYIIQRLGNYALKNPPQLSDTPSCVWFRAGYLTGQVTFGQLICPISVKNCQ